MAAPARGPLALGFLLLAAVCLGVWGGLVGAEFSNDDDLLIVSNLYIRDFSHLWDNLGRDYFYNSQGSSIGYWRPLTKLTYMVDWQLYGAEPAGYYATNVALFTLAILVAAGALLRSGTGPAVAFGAAVLAAVHPGHAESVGIVTSRSDLLAALFLASVLFFELRPVRTGVSRVAGPLVALLALLSKELGVIAPALVVVAHVAVRRTGWRAGIAASLPYVGVVAVYAAVRLSLGISPAAHTHAEVGTAAMAIATGKVAGIYAARIAVPPAVEPITRFASFPTSLDAATGGWCALAVASVLGLLWIARRKSAWLPSALIVFSIAPALSLRYISISEHADRLPVFDRGLFLPSLGFGWLLAAAFAGLAARFGAQRRGGGWVAVPVVLWAGVLGWQAVDNVADSQTAESRAAAFTEGLGGTPEEELPLYQRHIVLEERAIALAQGGDLAGAEKVFLELIELDETNAAARGNLAMLYRMTGRPELAVEQLRWVLEYQGSTRTARDRKQILIQLAQALTEAGRPQAAAQVWEKVQELEGQVPPAAGGTESGANPADG